MSFSNESLKTIYEISENLENIQPQISCNDTFQNTQKDIE